MAVTQLSATQNAALEAALDYAELGWAVLPLHSIRGGSCTCNSQQCNSPGKHPRWHREYLPNGVRSASADEQTIRRWFGIWPDSNVGIATGSVSGFVALDIDPRHGGIESLQALMAEHGPLTDTCVAHTGGGGLHVLFKHPGESVPNKVGIAPGLDIRGDGGFITAPPSVHASGDSYYWDETGQPEHKPLAPLPGWLHALVTRDKISGTQAEPRERLDVAKTLDGVPEGQRNRELFRLACKFRRADLPREHAEGLILEAAENCEPPLPAEEALRVVANAYEKYSPEPENADGKQPARKQSNGSTEPAAYEEFDVQVLLKGYEGTKALIPGLLYPGHLTLVGSWPGVGKTTLVRAVIAALITGLPAFGLLDVGTLTGDIAYFSELNGASLARTVQDMSDVYQLDPERVSDRLKVYGLTGESVLNANTGREFRQRCQGAGLVIIDTHDNWLAADPNSTQPVLAAWQVLRDVAREGAAVLVLDHQGKTALGYNEQMSAVSGSAAKQRHADLVYRLDRVTEPSTHNTLSCVKDRFGDATNLILRLDDDGRIVGSLPEGEVQQRRKVDQAHAFVRSYLSRREEAVLKDIREAAIREGHSFSTTRRALDQMRAAGEVFQRRYGVYALKRS